MVDTTLDGHSFCCITFSLVDHIAQWLGLLVDGLEVSDSSGDEPNLHLGASGWKDMQRGSGPLGGGWVEEYAKESCSKPAVAATVFFGANDAAILGRDSERQHVPVEEYEENLRKIVHHLKECSPTMLVVLITPPPVDEEGRNEYARSLHGDKARELPERTNESAGIYAKRCLEVAKELGLPSIDLWSKMQETEGWQKKFLSDGLHLTEEGNAVVHQELVRVFSKSSLHAEDMPNDFPHHSLIDGKNPEKVFQQKFYQN